MMLLTLTATTAAKKQYLKLRKSIARYLFKKTYSIFLTQKIDQIKLVNLKKHVTHD
jgi:hypothetical protein